MIENKPAQQHDACCSEDHSIDGGQASQAAVQTETRMLNTAAVLDNFGMVASALCLVHCLAMPFLIALLPFLGLQFLDSHESHMALAALIWAFALFAIVPSYLKHKKVPVLVGMCVGLGLVTAGAFFGHEVFGENGELGCMIVGNLILVSVHWINRGLCKCEH